MQDIQIIIHYGLTCVNQITSDGTIIWILNCQPYFHHSINIDLWKMIFFFDFMKGPYIRFSFNDKDKIDPILTVLGFSLICLNVLLAHPNKPETDRWDMCFMAKVNKGQKQ